MVFDTSWDASSVLQVRLQGGEKVRAGRSLNLTGQPEKLRVETQQANLLELFPLRVLDYPNYVQSA
jgi:hypothetical protein